MIKGFFGVNIAVSDLEAATQRFSQLLGATPTPMSPEDFAFPNLVGSRFTLGNGVIIQLIASQTTDTSIARFISSRGEGLFLITVETTDIDKDLPALAQKGFQLTNEKPILFSGGRVSFIHPRSLHGVQVEVFQPKKA